MSYKLQLDCCLICNSLRLYDSCSVSQIILAKVQVILSDKTMVLNSLYPGVFIVTGGSFLDMNITSPTFRKYRFNAALDVISTGVISITVADPGFPMGGADLVGGGRQLSRRLHFKKFVCQNERIWTRRGRAPAASPGSATASLHTEISKVIEIA